MPRKRSTYTAEFKLHAVRMIADRKLAVAEVARRLEVGEYLLRTWKNAFEERGSGDFPGHGYPTPADDELRRPRAENARLRAGRGLVKRRRVLRQPAEESFRFIADHAGEWTVTWMREALEVSASGYYVWTSRPDSPTEQWRQEMAGAIEEVHAEAKQRYGSPRTTAERKARGYECSENMVAKLVSAHWFKPRVLRRFARATDSDHRSLPPPNVPARGFDPDGPNESWCVDITYIPTGKGWLYLAVVEDLFSRMVVWWAMAESMESRLVVDAPEMALARRCPGAGLLAHSDREGQYASDHYQRVLAAAGIVCGTSGVGPCWDDAPVESLFGRVKRELGAEVVATRGPARAALFEYLEVFDNRVHSHSSVGFVSQAEFEWAHSQTHR